MNKEELLQLLKENIEEFNKYCVKNNFNSINLSGADLRGADLRRADLRSADLSRADLRKMKINENTIGIQSICPETGSFECWGKKNNILVKMLVPEEAKRSSATTRKCRAEFVKVLKVFNEAGYIECNNKKSITYKDGETVYPDFFDENRWNECSNGIHFFMTKIEAENW